VGLGLVMEELSVDTLATSEILIVCSAYYGSFEFPA